MVFYDFLGTFSFYNEQVFVQRAFVNQIAKLNPLELPRTIQNDKLKNLYWHWRKYPIGTIQFFARLWPKTVVNLAAAAISFPFFQYLCVFLVLKPVYFLTRTNKKKSGEANEN